MFTLLQQNFNSQLYYSFTILLVVLREFVTVLTRYTPIAASVKSSSYSLLFDVIILFFNNLPSNVLTSMLRIV